MPHFSSNVARSTSLADTYTHHIHVVLDCYLCIYYNPRFAILLYFIIYIYTFHAVSLMTGGCLAYKKFCFNAIFMYIFISS